MHGLKETMAKSKEAGMQTFDQALFDLYEAGEISYEDAMRNADSVSEFKLNVKLNARRKPAGEAGRPKVELSLHPEKEEEELAPQELFAKPAAAGAAAPSTVQAAAK